MSEPTVEQLEANLRQLELHTRALTAQLTSAEEFYYNDCAQGNLLRGWDSNFATNSNQSRSKLQQMPDSARVFSGASAIPMMQIIPQNTNIAPQPSLVVPSLEDTPTLYQDLPTIIAHKATTSALLSHPGQPTYSTQPLGATKRTM